MHLSPVRVGAQAQRNHTEFVEATSRWNATATNLCGLCFTCQIKKTYRVTFLPLSAETVATHPIHRYHEQCGHHQLDGRCAYCPSFEKIATTAAEFFLYLKLLPTPRDSWAYSSRGRGLYARRHDLAVYDGHMPGLSASLTCAGRRPTTSTDSS